MLDLSGSIVLFANTNFSGFQVQFNNGGIAGNTSAVIDMAGGFGDAGDCDGVQAQRASGPSPFQPEPA